MSIRSTDATTVCLKNIDTFVYEIPELGYFGGMVLGFVLFLNMMIALAWHDYNQQIMLSQDKADILAGNIAGYAFVTVAQPLDYIKTMYQVKADHLPTIRQIYQQIGIKGFYKGASSIYFFSGAITALQFESFQRSLLKIKEWMGQQKQSESSVLSLMMAGFTSGAICSFIYTPTQYSKIQSQIHHFPEQGSTRRIFDLIKRQKLGGIKKLYTGHPVTMLKQSIGSSFYYGSYHITLTRVFKQKREEASTWAQFLAGGFAGIINQVYTYPLDTIKTNIQSGHKTLNEMTSNRFWLTSNFRNGLRISLFSSFISEATNFVVYEKLRIFLMGPHKKDNQ